MPPSNTPARRQKILLNGSTAVSLLNFRGPLIAELAGRGHEVHVSTPDLGDVDAAKLRALGAEPHDVPLARTGLNPFADLIYYRAMRRLLSEVRPDLCLSYTIKPNIWASLAASSLGIRSASMVTGLGYTFIGGRGARQRVIGRFARTLYRAATKANAVVIFQNPDDLTDFVDAGCLSDPAKARLVNGSGVDLTYFTPAPLPGEPVFLMVSRLLGNKGVREYAAAARRLIGEGRKARFQLAGFIDEGLDGISPHELQQWITDGIEYLGHLDDVRPALRAASVCVLPSYREGTPRSVLEAMAMGRAIVTTDEPGCRETVVDGVNGLLVPARDENKLAQAMAELIDHPQRRAAMGAQSLELARAKYDVKTVNAVLLNHLGLD